MRTKNLSVHFNEQNELYLGVQKLINFGFFMIFWKSTISEFWSTLT